MNLINRRVECEVRKAIQEVQFEPFEVTMKLSGDVPDNVDLDLEFEEAEKFLEDKVFKAIYEKLEV